ncbi:MAG: hypothetical protein GXY25_16015 [Pirellulaceae bacterium]|jgi:hypothetical protein|nr:hypothetical protein [Thermoguttaceae bacterium]NLZ02029.1 hypothetical protein [Pirellulaceae bacterium]
MEKKSNVGRSPVMKRVAVGSAVLAVLVIGLTIVLAKGGSGPPAESEIARAPVANEVVSNTVSKPAIPKAEGPGMLAMEQAAKEKKYLFAFFWKSDQPRGQLHVA